MRVNPAWHQRRRPTRDRFWINSQPYSLQDMLADDEPVDQFVGATLYQAFLSATDYHRWHSPVAGTIARAFVTDGIYYSEADSEAVEPTNFQSYLAQGRRFPITGNTVTLPDEDFAAQLRACVVDSS